MRLLVLCPGGLTAAPAKALCEDYEQRCRRFGTPLEFGAVRARRLGAGRPVAEVLNREGEALLAAVPAGYRTVALAAHGKTLDTPAFARELGRWRDSGLPGAAFLVGSAAGLSADVYARVHECWSLSALTLQHDLAQAVLAEQLYRALTLLAGHPYHKV